jgi:hypothetical protein
MLGHGICLRWLSRHCSARLLSGGVLSLLVTVSALAGSMPSQPTAVVPADVAVAVNATNTKCQTTVVKDQPLAVSQKTSSGNSASAAPAPTELEAAETADPPKTEILQDKLWSTSLSRSSKDNEVQKAPQCGMATAGQPPAD